MSAYIIPAPPDAYAKAFTGSGNPNTFVTATGIAWYFDVSTPSSPTIWFKATAGTSSTDWIILGTFSN